MKSSHDLAKELLALPPKPMLMDGCGSDEGITIIVDRVIEDGTHNAYRFAASKTEDPYPHGIL